MISLLAKGLLLASPVWSTPGTSDAVYIQTYCELFVNDNCKLDINS